MSENTPAAGNAVPSPVRTLAVRITDDLRAQLDVIAQLNGHSVSEEIRLTLEAYATSALSDPKLVERAEAMRSSLERDVASKQSAIEREAQAKRDAIATILGPQVGTKTTRGKATPSS